MKYVIRGDLRVLQCDVAQEREGKKEVSYETNPSNPWKIDVQLHMMTTAPFLDTTKTTEFFIICVATKQEQQ